ncbi:MAG: alpha/beta fold hydrolase [Candidatus Eremiobacteraeota bacterium]|nr:alpha/beta fold hydrolase [Candidatus Eremiobacteraeota bacterium]
MRTLAALLVLAASCLLPLSARAADSEVFFTSRDGSRLAATLSMPENVSGPVPAVFFVHDTGALDRDEQIGPNHIFRDIAQPLVASGVAVLRYDKRSVGGSVTLTQAAKVVRQNFIEDEMAALVFLQHQPGIDSQNIFALGHSEGAELVTALALTGVPLRGVVLLSPPSMSYGLFISRQLKAHPDAQPRVDRLRETAWFKSVENVDPVLEYAKLQLPVLLVQGSADLINPATELPRVQLAARERAKDVTIDSLDGDNHFFMHLAPGIPSTGKEYQQAREVDPRVMDAIALWLHSHVH